jgi:hypothetical protein
MHYMMHPKNRKAHAVVQLVVLILGSVFIFLRILRLRGQPIAEVPRSVEK